MDHCLKNLFKYTGCIAKSEATAFYSPIFLVTNKGTVLCKAGFDEWISANCHGGEADLTTYVMRNYETFGAANGP